MIYTGTNRVIRAIMTMEGLAQKIPNTRKVRAYYDKTGNVWTIGYGTTKNIKANDVITYNRAEELLMRDIAEFQKLLVNYQKYRGYQLNQNQFDALLSFVYNNGSIRAGSDLDNSLRNKNYTNAVETLKRYVYSGGQILAGLVKRRNYEAALFSLLPGKRLVFNW